VLLALLLLLHTAQCGFHFSHTLQYGLPIGQHAGFELVILGVPGG